LYVAALFLARRRAGWFVLSAMIAYLFDVCLIHHRDLPSSLAFFLADTGEAGIGRVGIVCRVRPPRQPEPLARRARRNRSGGGSRTGNRCLIGDACRNGRIRSLVLPDVVYLVGRRCPRSSAGGAGDSELAAIIVAQAAPLPAGAGDRIWGAPGGLSIFTAVTLKTHPGRLLAVPYPVLPFLVWAALRFGPLETSLAFVVMSVSSFWYATQGPGAVVTRLDDLLQVELFLSVIDISFLILAGVTAERRMSIQILSRNHVLLQAIYQAQADFIGARHLGTVLERLLDDSQSVTGSTFGFIGELRRAEADNHAVHLIAARGTGAPDLRSALPSSEIRGSDISQNLRDLVEKVARTGQPVLARDVCTVMDGAGDRSTLGDFVCLPCHHLGKLWASWVWRSIRVNTIRRWHHSFRRCC